MSEKPFSTEQAQSAIDVVIDSIREACVPLIEKLAEIEKQAFTENTEQAIAIIKLRLDVLAKIELKLQIGRAHV